MKFKSKVFVIALMMLLLLCVSGVSASENETLLSDDSGEVLTSNEDEILLDLQENEVVSSTDEDMLSAKPFKNFQEDLVILKKAALLTWNMTFTQMVKALQQHISPKVSQLKGMDITFLVMERMVF